MKALKNHSIQWWLILSILLLFSECSQAKYQEFKVPVETSSQYNYQVDGQCYDRCWWKEFNSQYLNNYIENLISTNLDIKQAWDRLSQSIASSNIVKSYKIPNISISFSGSHTEKTWENQWIGTTNELAMPLLLSYEFDLWEKLGARHKASQHECKAIQEDLQSTIEFTIATACTLWLHLLENKEIVQLTKKQYELQKNLVSITEFEYKKGENTLNKLRKTKIELSALEDTIPKLLADQEILTQQLCVLSGKPPHYSFENHECILYDPLPPFPELCDPKNLICNRPDLRALYQRIQASNMNIATHIADSLPSFPLSMVCNFTSSTFEDFFKLNILNVAQKVIQPLFDCGRKKEEIKLQKAVLSEKLHLFGKKFLEAFKEIEETIIYEKRGLESLSAIQKQVKFLRESYEEEKNRYSKGVSDNPTLLTAKIEFIKIQIKELTQKTRLFVNRSKLYRALGGKNIYLEKNNKGNLVCNENIN